MEFRDSAHPLRTRSQEGSPEMQSILLLTESGTRYDANSGCVQEAEGVEFIGGEVLFLRGFYGFAWEVDRWEEVHGALLPAKILVLLVLIMYVGEGRDRTG